MRLLEKTRVLRGGSTSRWYDGEGTNRVHLHLREINDGTGEANSVQLLLTFSIPSAGGGHTDLKVVVPPEDLESILDTLASSHPSTYSMLSRAAKLAERTQWLNKVEARFQEKLAAVERAHSEQIQALEGEHSDALTELEDAWQEELSKEHVDTEKRLEKVNSTLNEPLNKLEEELKRIDEQHEGLDTDHLWDYYNDIVSALNPIQYGLHWVKIDEQP
ncbi:MAG: hypothetical protein RhofKO_04700 [Rhodothermales bacterium]